jgi:hypothetical protein
MSAEPTHPLNARDAAESEIRIANIEQGVAGGDGIDRSYWLAKLRSRITALEDDEKIFGLVPHEQAELASLKAIRSKLEMLRRG